MNYEIMKQSEKELQIEFIKFCEHIYTTWQFVFKITKSKKFTQTELNGIYQFEDISNHFEAQIQDDCIWSISKNEPMANHLRYVIAVLNSIKDLERMGDYAVNTVRYFVNNQAPDDIRLLVIEILQKALLGIAKINKSLKFKPAVDTYKICQSVHITFKKEYDEMLEKLSGILKKRSVEQIEKLFQGGIIIIKHIERLMDHMANIAENFMFIKQPDLFFDKQSKQVLKK